MGTTVTGMDPKLAATLIESSNELNKAALKTISDQNIATMEQMKKLTSDVMLMLANRESEKEENATLRGNNKNDNETARAVNKENNQTERDVSSDYNKTARSNNENEFFVGKSMDELKALLKMLTQMTQASMINGMNAGLDAATVKPKF
jgi:hypothetical protein